MNIVLYILNAAKEALSLLVIIHVILTYFMDPYHPVRRWVDQIVEPMLMPIRRVVPLVGMFDFSPIILFFLIRLIFNLIIIML